MRFSPSFFFFVFKSLYFFYSHQLRIFLSFLFFIRANVCLLSNGATDQLMIFLYFFLTAVCCMMYFIYILLNVFFFCIYEIFFFIRLASHLLQMHCKVFHIYSHFLLFHSFFFFRHHISFLLIINHSIDLLFSNFYISRSLNQIQKSSF